MIIPRIIVAVVGMLLPYLVRLPHGTAWVLQYTDVSLFGFLFFNVWNAIAWGSIIAVSFLYRRPVSLLCPSVFAFGFLGWAHYTLDLASDPQAAAELAGIPIYALVFVVVGGLLGYALDRWLTRHPAG